MSNDRCLCPECVELDALPERLQGIPGAVQLKLPTEREVITPEIFQDLLDQVRAAGFGDDVDWSENISLPDTAEEFVREAIFVICNSGMRFTVARGIFDRVMAALERGESAGIAFGHKGKAEAIDFVWHNRAELMAEYLDDEDQLEWCQRRIPWVGPITKFHLAKNFGLQVAKPDIHLQRLADREGITPQYLCERLAAATGLKVPTVDTVLWRACSIGIINSREI